jgi:hypothetical protein
MSVRALPVESVLHRSFGFPNRRNTSIFHVVKKSHKGKYSSEPALQEKLLE